MSLEVFVVEEDWSCACISVRKGCVFDIIRIAYASLIFISLRLCWKCLRVSWTLEAAWECFENFLRPLGPIWGSLRRPWHVLEGLRVSFWSILERRVGPLEVSSRGFSERCIFDALWVSWRQIFGDLFIENWSSSNEHLIAHMS